MFCSKCGNKINEEAKFCKECGADLGLKENFEIQKVVDQVNTSKKKDKNLLL